MTERLSALLHDEADRIDLPVAPARESLAEGRRLVRRRHLGQVVAVAAVVALVGAGAAAVTAGRDTAGPVTNGGADAGATGAGVSTDMGYVFASGNTVYLDGGAAQVRMDEVAQTLYYTSAGLLVRTNADGMSDGGAPFHFALVTYDGSRGSVEPLDLTLGEVVPSTDGRQPYVAYAETDGGRVDVVVRDVSTDEEVARVDLGDVGPWGGWEAPPVSLDSDTVYVGFDDGALAVDWRTGEVAPSDVLPPGPPDVRGGRTIVREGATTIVVDARTGARVFEVPTRGEFPWTQLSPDGRTVVTYDQQGGGDFDRYAVDTSQHTVLPGAPQAYGWLPLGQAYSVTPRGITECIPTEFCHTSPLPDGVELGDFVRLGGRTYES